MTELFYRSDLPNARKDHPGAQQQKPHAIGQKERITAQETKPRRVVLLHSSGLSSLQWRGAVPALNAAGYSVVTPDFLGCGKSPAGRNPFHWEQDVAAVRTLLANLGPSAVVGHSYGGAVALRLALEAPANLLAVATFDPVLWGIHYERHGEGILEEFNARFFRPDLRGTTEWMQAFVDYWGGPQAFDKLSEPARAMMLASGAQTFDQVVTLAEDHNTRDAYANLEIPALVMGGRKTPKEMREVGDVLAEALPLGQRVYLPGGHMSPITAREQFTSALLAFLNSSMA